MFFLLELAKELELAPRFFGPKLHEIIEEKLSQEVEGTCNGNYGFIICVLNILSIGKGMIRDGTGAALFNVKYTCVAFRPFKGETIDCVVTDVNKMGFFATAGPLNVFVSNHLIPEDFKLQNVEEMCYVSEDESLRIQLGTEVRIRIVGARIDAQEIFCVGTIKEEFLGVVGLVA